MNGISSEIFALRSGKHGRQGKEHIAVGGQSVDVLLFEDDLDTQLPQFLHHIEAFRHTAGEAGNRPDQDEVEFLLHSLDGALEISGPW